jgi:regulatory protein
VAERASAARPARTLKQRAIALLARREYARAELAARLAASGAAKEEVDRVLDELVEAGYLSDVRFASALVRQRSGRYAKRAIVQALREKGVPAATVGEVMKPLENLDELAAARALWQRRFGVAPVDERQRARQLRFLISRGYSAAIAFRVLRTAGARIDEDE